MITIRAEDRKYFFSDFINLSNGKEASLDETLLTFRQSEPLNKALLQKDATEEHACCGTPNTPIVEYTEESPLPP